jgi:hypothetical protein
VDQIERALSASVLATLAVVSDQLAVDGKKTVADRMERPEPSLLFEHRGRHHEAIGGPADGLGTSGTGERHEADLVGPNSPSNHLVEGIHEPVRLTRAGAAYELGCLHLTRILELHHHQARVQALLRVAV